MPKQSFNPISGNFDLVEDNASCIKVEHCEGCELDSVQDYINNSQSAGRIKGGLISEYDATHINVEAGTGWLRIADDDESTLKFIKWDAVTNQAMDMNSITQVYVDYNDGDPIVKFDTTGMVLDLDTQFPLGSVTRDNNHVHIINNPYWVADALTNIIQRFDGANGNVQRDVMVGGLILGETGTRNVTMSAGRVWSRLNDFEIDSVNTSISGQYFDAYYRDLSTDGWADLHEETQWDNQHFDNGSGTLATLDNNKYAVLWFYIEADGDLVCVYGRNQYVNVSSAEQEQPPSTIPPRLTSHGMLIGRLIFQKGESTATEINSAFDIQFSPAITTNHSDLSNLDYVSSGHTGFQPAGSYITAETDPLFTEWENTTEYIVSGDNVSELTNDAGYLVEHQDLSGYVQLSPATAQTGDVTITGKVESKSLKVVGEVVQLSVPTNISASFNYSGTGFFDYGYLHAIRVYAYKEVAGIGKIFSLVGQSTTYQDAITYSQEYAVNWSWDVVAGADGYRVLPYLNEDGFWTEKDYDYYKDVATNSFTDDNTGWTYSASPTITPTEYVDNEILLNEIEVVGNDIISTGTITFANVTGTTSGINTGDETASGIKTKLETLTGTARLSATAIKDIPNPDLSIVVGFVNHGSTAGTARPTTVGKIIWTGTVEPTNAANYDEWNDIS